MRAEEHQIALGDFPNLKTDPLAQGKQVRICIVTPEFVGPYRNGGVGTAYTCLAQILAQAGHEVTVLYTGPESSESGSTNWWQQHYLSQGILFVCHRPPEGISIDAPYYGRISYEIFLWLRENHQRFDIVHFPELLGQAYYSVLAKKQGIAFADLSFCVGVHSSTKWVELGNQRLFFQADQLDADFLERESVKLADVVISPSQYLLKWMQKDGWQLPDRVYVAPYAVPPELYTRDEQPPPSLRRRNQREDVKELIFFGRLEPRKGLMLFCDAMDLLSPDLVHGEMQVTFLGKPSLVHGEDATSYLARRAQNWQAKTQILSKDRSEALTYLKNASAGLVIIPSVQDNYPNTVLECLALHIPFIASDVGGISEQIRSDYRARVLFAPRADYLAVKIAETIRGGPTAAVAAFDFRTSNETLVKWHEQSFPLATKADTSLTHSERPLVSVCLAHFNRPVFLRAALESLRNQDHSWPFEVILVDDASTTEEARAYLRRIEPEFKEKGWQIIRQEHSYIGAARNAAARHSRGKYLLFMDDDNYAEPDEIGTLAAIAERTGADILTCVCNIFTSNGPPDHSSSAPRRYRVPIGAALESGLFRNGFGDANALIKREAFESLGGFVEVHGTSGEDWELFVRAVLCGMDLQVVPLPLFWYRIHEKSMTRVTSPVANHFLAIKPYLENDGHRLPGITLMTLGQTLELERWGIQGQALNGTGLNLGLLSEIDHLWGSRSLLIFRPLRNLRRRFKGLAEESKPVPKSSNEAAQAIIQLRSSLSWELTSPIRIAHRILTNRRKHP